MTMRQWEKAQMRKRYAEYMRLQLFHTGKCRTHYLEFTYMASAESVTIRSGSKQPGNAYTASDDSRIIEKHLFEK